MFSQRARARASLCRLDRMLIDEPKGHPSYQARVAASKLISRAAESQQLGQIATVTPNRPRRPVGGLRRDLGRRRSSGSSARRDRPGVADRLARRRGETVAAGRNAGQLQCEVQAAGETIVGKGQPRGRAVEEGCESDREEVPHLERDRISPSSRPCDWHSLNEAPELMSLTPPELPKSRLAQRKIPTSGGLGRWPRLAAGFWDH